MKLTREILRLAGPSILANVTVPLVGMVDIAVVGHLGGTGAMSGAALIGGISIGTMLFDLLYWNFAFLRAGTGGLTAQAYGRLRGLYPLLSPAAFSPSTSLADGKSPGPGRAPDGASLSPRTEARDELGTILRRALRVALVSALGILLLQWVVVKAAFLVVHCSPEVRALATQYFYIRVWAAPATLSLFAFKGWFIGLQDSVRPMTADLLVNGLNIVLSVLLSFGLPALPGIGFAGIHGLGFAGVALGTVLAQWAGLAYCLAAAYRRYGFSVELNAFSLRRLHKISKENFLTNFKETPQNQDVSQFFTINRDLFLRSAGMIAVYIGFTVIGATLGDEMLAVSAILMKLLMVFSYFTDGFAYAGEALTGRFIGEGSSEGVGATIRQTFRVSWAVAGIFVLAYGLCGSPLLRLMTSDAAVVEAGKAFLPWLMLMPLIGCPAFVWDGIFIGATASADLRNSTLLCAVGFFSVWFIGKALWGPMPPATGLHLLMAAYFVHLAIRSVYLTLRSPSLR